MNELNLVTLVKLLAFINLIPTSLARPQLRNQCTRTDQVALKYKSGKMVCWNLKKCPHGLGLSFHYISGKIYSSALKISCNPCLAGKTYSDKEDYSQCKKCSKCKKHEISIGKCQIDKDEIKCTGQCKRGYYWSTNTQSCQPCHECCHKNANGSLCDSCPQELYKNCTLAIKKNITENGSTFTNNTKDDKILTEEDENVSKNMDNKKKEEKSVGSAQLVFVGFASFVVVLAPVILFIVHAIRPARHMPLRNRMQRNNNQRYGNEIPQTLDDMEGNAEEGNGIYAAEADSLIQMDKRRVKDLSDKECCKICDMLDKKESFFRDYRLLGEELGMERSKIDQLKKEPSPTLSILKEYHETSLEDFCQALQAIHRNDALSVFGIMTECPEPDPILQWE